MATTTTKRSAEYHDRERRRLGKYRRNASAEAADIADEDKYGEAGLPSVVSPERRESCRLDLHKFLVTYFPHSTGLSPFGDAQVNAIKRFERAALKGGRSIDLEPRGYVKSTRSENGCIWLICYGHRNFPMFLGANDEMASVALASIKLELSENELLFADFPEICYPIRCLENKPQRCKSQSFKGKLTHIGWTSDRIVVPVINDSGGQLIATAGLMAATRGLRHKMPSGKQIRPDFVVIDDPQTDESAASPTMTQKRLRVLQRSIAQLGGHGSKVSIVINATVIQPGDMVDQLADPQKHPEWPTVRSSALRTLPPEEAIEKHWLGEYKRIRGRYDVDDPEGPEKARAASTEYYNKHRAEMDGDAVAEWEHVPLEDDEASPIQHAMNVWVDDGEDAFWSEVMNKPRQPVVSAPLDLDRTELNERINGISRRIVPDGRPFVTFHIDVHDELLFWTVAAVGQDFSGDVIDYGTWPEQNSQWFTLRNCKQKLTTKYRGITCEQAIERGCEDLVSKLFATPWIYADGNEAQIACGLIDAGYKGTEVANAIRKSGHEGAVFTSKGIGIGPTNKPMPAYDMSRKRVLRAGPDPRAPRWYFPVEHIDNGVRRVHFDANFWKDSVASRFTQQSPDGAWHLFGRSGVDHGPFIEHLTAEKPTQLTAQGNTVNVWKNPPGKDNHWWDTLVGCAVAASIAGALLPTQGTPPKAKAKKRRRRRVSPLKM